MGVKRNPLKRKFFDEIQTQQQTHEATMSGNVCSVSPPWEVLSLIASKMDGKTLATGSCVSKTWSLCFSSEHLWRSFFAAHHHSLSAASSTKFPAISYKRLYSIAEFAATRRCGMKQRPNPKISLSDLTFIVRLQNSSMNLTIVKQGKYIMVPSDGLFRFNIDVNHEGSTVILGDAKQAKVSWHVFFRDWESVFMMTNRVRSLEKKKWFCEDLPAPEYCGFHGGSGLAADVNLEFTGDLGEETRTTSIKKLGLGIMNTVDLRYLKLDDGLRYLERFLFEQGRE